ncbi:serine hydrolase domain-containing protein [Draconibacterium halophilum]|uniref:Beta-lactamase family protein n=1 Tax=Draconibacterium halophilum TaxID=2706887 RepID=A0A6C0RG17_9BACT|nr:serine hydrolase domain-containing protein [Draconibacterium halophilum]QIA08772.1 beta-lactamase family protein [Draconibacterium halophilum]
MKSIKAYFPLLLVLVLGFTGCTSTKEEQKTNTGMLADSLASAENLIQQYIDEGELAGFSALVIKDGEEVLRMNKGYADRENEISIEPNTIFRIFSMSKPITAVALMTLYDEGRFDLDDKVSDYIPKYAGIKVYTPNDNGFSLEEQQPEMTIRHLLTHTSGISYGWNPTYVDSLYRVNNVSGWDGKLEDKMLLLADMPLNFQPGTQWMYGLSIDVAGYLVEVISGQPFDEYLQEHVFGPLKMDDTGFYVPEEKHDRLCNLYNQGDDNRLQPAQKGFADAFKEPVTLFSGGGGLVSTVDDYARFCKMLLNGGELNGARILKPETVKMIMSNQLPETASYENGNMGFGLAGAVDFESGEYSWAGMASTNFWINPTNQLIIITATQILPSNYGYANEFKSKIDNSLTK